MPHIPDVEENLITKDLFTPEQILSIDFAQQFSRKLTSILTLLGVTRKMPMASGAVIKTYKSTVTLTGGKVEPGDIIPLSKVQRTPADTYELAWDKRRKAVPMEVIQQVGFEAAIEQTDAAFIREIQKGIRATFLAQLEKGTGTVKGTGLQETMANAWAGVVKAFDEDDVDVIGFINPEDAASYLAKASISTQSAFGMTYLENFLSFKVAFMHPSVPKGKVYATAAQNLVLAYAQLTGAIANEFDMTLDDLGMIGITHDVNKQRLTAETITAYGIVLFAENLSGVVKGTIQAGTPA